jgi:uncharacterized protein YuzE
MEKRHLDARGTGEHTYDYANDILLFKIRDRDYAISIDFDNLIVDVDTKGFITGMRIFDASELFGLSKLALNNVKSFEFNAKAENKIITIQLRFTSVLRNKPVIRHSQDIVREASDSHIKDSQVMCTVA